MAIHVYKNAKIYTMDPGAPYIASGYLPWKTAASRASGP